MKTRIYLLLCPILLFCALSVQAQNGGGSRRASALYESGREAMLGEDWYGAVESFQEALRINPNHAGATGSLAECYYELSEYDEALSWVRKARLLSRASMDLANLEAFILIAMGQLDAASRIASDVLAREPYNQGALFAQAEMDIARGRAGDAVIKYREVARRYPDDRRVLLSLALVLGSLGEDEKARPYIERVLKQHPEDYRVYYYAAYLDSRAGRIREAIHHARRSLSFRPGFRPAEKLLAVLSYRSADFEAALSMADALIRSDPDDVSVRYLKGMALAALGRNADAISVLSSALSRDPDDEFVRCALEDLLLSNTAVEDKSRKRWADWHFRRAKDFRNRNLSEQALFEYRRGLRLYPLADDRRAYAELLRIQGFPARYMEELRFMQDQGLTKSGDQSIDDAVETYSSMLSSALYRRWDADPLLVCRRHWKFAVFSLASQSGFTHVDAGAVAASYIRDLLSHDRNIEALDLELKQESFSRAFRSAREGGADYFMAVSITENERDLSVRADLYVGRTGSPAQSFSAFRSGPDRLRNAAKSVLEQIAAALPFRGELVKRRADLALIDKGRADGVQADQIFEIVKKGSLGVKNEGMALVYGAQDIVGTITISEIDEEVAAGKLIRNGYSDRISAGDEIILQQEKKEEAAPPESADPELRALLRRLN